MVFTEEEVMTIKENPLIPHLLKAVKDNNFITELNNKEVKYEHVDLALVPVDKIDSKGYIFTNRNARLIIEKANKLEIPVYCYTHSLNFVPVIKGKAIKPDLVKSIISELGIFEPEVFVQEAKLNYPWLLK